MDHNAIIARAFEITRRHKALWIFGFLAAFAGGSGSSANFGNSSSGSGSGVRSPGDLMARIQDMDFPGREFVVQLLRELETLGAPSWLDFDRLADPGAGDIGGILAVLMLFCGAIIVLFIGMVLIRLISEAAIIRMVDAIEEGDAVSFGYGLELALTGRTARWFLLELLAGLLSLLIVLPLLLITIVPIVLVIAQDGNPLILVLALGLILLGIPLLILFIIGYSMLQRLWSREVLIGGADMGSAVAGAAGLLRGNFLSILLLWFILLVLRMIYFAVSVFLFFVALFIAAAVGIAVGALIYGAGASAITTAVIGFLVTMAFLSIPVIFLSGLFLVFDSSAWTLAWRWMDGAGLAEEVSDPALDPNFGGEPEAWPDQEPAPPNDPSEAEAPPWDSPGDDPPDANRDPFAGRALPVFG